ncbi:hypothetical protein D3C59_37125, partial [Streptomyces sp. SHP22-7]
MTTNQPSPEQLKQLQQAHLKATRTSTAVSQARTKLDEALAQDANAQAELARAIVAVLYGPPAGDPP